MYKVEINGSEVLMDLIGRMADLAGAKYETRLVLETESTRLASAVSVLLGEPVVVDPELDERTGLGFGLLGDPGINSGANGDVVQISSVSRFHMTGDNGKRFSDHIRAALHEHEEQPAGDFGGLLNHVANFDAATANGKVNGTAAEAESPKCRYCGKGIAKGRSMCRGAECQRKAKHEQDERYADKRRERAQARLAEKDYGECEFCEAPRQPRSKICGSAMCKQKLQKKHQMAYEARKAEKEAQAAQAKEAATSEGPLAGAAALYSISLGTGPWYEVEYPDQTIRLTLEELKAKNAAGEIPDGTLVRAQPSGRLYALRAGLLTRVDQGETGKAQ